MRSSIVAVSISASVLLGGWVASLALADPHYGALISQWVGTATGPLDMQGEDLILGDDDCMFTRAAENTYAWQCGSGSAEFYLDTFGITVSGGVGRINMGGQPIISTTGVLELGGSCTTAYAGGAGDICADGDAEVHGTTNLGGSVVVVGAISNTTDHVTLTPAAGKAARVTTGLLALDETTVPTVIAGVAQLFATATDQLKMITDGGTFTIGGSIPGWKSYTHPTTTASTQWLAGFYDFPAADANLDQATPAITHGTANDANAAYIVIVAGGAGTVDAGTVSIVVSGTSISNGSRVTSDTETIVADITTLALDQKVQSLKKWLGTATITLTSAGATNYSLDFNYGHASVENFGHRGFTVSDFNATFHGGANETDLQLVLYHHSSAGWTYNATAFEPGGTVIASLAADYLTDDNLSSGDFGSYERDDLSTLVDGADSEGVIVKIVTAVNNSLHHINVHIGANF